MNLSPLPIQKFFDNNGRPLVGGLLFTYEAGTSTKVETYQDADGTLNTNPIELDYRGECNVWLDISRTYKFVLSPYGDTDPPSKAIWTIDDIACPVSLPDLTQQILGLILYPRTPEEISASITPSNYGYPFGDPRRYGAIGDGSNNDSVAWQAIATLGYGRIPENFSMKISTGASATGRVDIRGSGNSSKLLCDSAVITVTNGTDSVIDNLWMENITAPWIITRDPADWTANISGTLQQSNAAGYQPTVNDSDIWGSLTTAQQNQQIGPVITFTGNAENIQVSRIYGRFVLIDIQDAQRSVIQDCNYRAGKGTWGGAVFNNDTGAQEGRFNRLINNVIRYASFSGANFKNNFDGLAEGNIISLCGESGIKTNANDGVTSLTNCFNMTITANKCHQNYFDGFDLLTSYPASDAISGSYIVTDNDSYGNGGTGINADGKNNLYQGNKIWNNWREGFWGYCSYSLIDGNVLIDNNQERNASQPEMLAGDPSTSGHNTITNNKILSGAGQNSAAIYADGPEHFISGNFAIVSNFVFASSGVHLNNSDAASGLLTPQAFTLLVFNNAGTFQHQIISEYSGNALGNLSYKVTGASATLSNTPTGTDSSTAFVAGVKIGSAAPNTLYLDTASQVSANFESVVVVATNDSGQPLHVMAQLSNININGVTRNRLAFVLTKNDGTAYNINTTNFTSGKGFRLQFRGVLS